MAFAECGLLGLRAMQEPRESVVRGFGGHFDRYADHRCCVRVWFVRVEARCSSTSSVERLGHEILGGLG